MTPRIYTFWGLRDPAAAAWIVDVTAECDGRAFRFSVRSDGSEDSDEACAHLSASGVAVGAVDVTGVETDGPGL